MQDMTTYKQVFDRMGYEDQETATLMMRLQLIKQIKQEIEQRNWNQRQAAEVLDVAQPRIAEIIGLRVDKFSVELLTKYLYRLGRRVTLTIR